jgi:hypothetical protein
MSVISEGMSIASVDAQGHGHAVKRRRIHEKYSEMKAIAAMSKSNQGEDK